MKTVMSNLVVDQMSMKAGWSSARVEDGCKCVQMTDGE